MEGAEAFFIKLGERLLSIYSPAPTGPRQQTRRHRHRRETEAGTRAASRRMGAAAGETLSIITKPFQFVWMDSGNPAANRAENRRG